ncbi:hypothetical protein LXL04_019975 [Taraxacum kok-saghyz]
MSEEGKRSPSNATFPAKPPFTGDDRKITASSLSTSTSSSRKVVFKSADMKEEMQNEAFENCSVEKDVPEQIKKEFDKNHGPTWHCIVGKNFEMSEEGKRSPSNATFPAKPPFTGDDRKITASSLSTSTSSSRKVVIKSADMKEEMQNENCSVEKDVPEQIKKEFDKNHGPTWHCIVGKNFVAKRWSGDDGGRSELSELWCKQSINISMKISVELYMLLLIASGNRVLKDPTTLEDNKVAENSFIVIMLSKGISDKSMQMVNDSYHYFELLDLGMLILKI